MKTKKDLRTENWYYLQTFREKEFKCMETIIFAMDTDEAQRKADSWAKKNKQDGKRMYYHKNYIREAEKMVEEGNYVE